MKPSHNQGEASSYPNIEHLTSPPPHQQPHHSQLPLLSTPPALFLAHQAPSPPKKPSPAQNLDKAATRTQSNRNKSGSTSRVEQDNAKLSHIIKSRRELLQQLGRLQYEESQAKQNQRKSVDPVARSHLTKEQIAKINQALQARKQFEEASRQKLIDLGRKIRAQSIEQHKEQMQRMEHERAAHKQEALQRLELLQQKKQQRQADISQTNQKLQLLQNQQYLHQTIEQRWKNIQHQQQLRDQSTLQEIHHRRSLSIEDIAKHQQLYQARRQRDIEQRQKRLETDKLTKSRIQQATLSQFQPSRFLRTIFEQQNNKQRQRENKRKQYRTYTLKKTEYSQIIKELNQNRWRNSHLKPIPQQGQPPPQPPVPRKKQPSLSQVELLKLGNSYMRQVHSSIGHIEHKVEFPKNPSPEQKKSENYLTRMREERQEKEKGKTGNTEAREIREFKSVLKRTGPLEDKLYLVKLLTSKMEERAGRDSRMMVASINAKLQMISHLVEA